MSSLLDEIVGGAHDDSLDLIRAAIDERRNVLARRLAITLQPGDKVRFNDNASPKYMRGQLAEVVSAGSRGAKVQVKLLEPVGRLRAGYPIGCSTQIIDKVED